MTALGIFLSVFKKKKKLVYSVYNVKLFSLFSPKWGAAHTEIKVPSGENTELKRSPFKALSRSVYSYTCYAYHQGFLPRFFLPFRSIHLHFFPNLSRFLLCWMCLTHGSCVGPQNQEVTLPETGSRVECPRNMNRPKNMTCGMVTCEINDLEMD